MTRKEFVLARLEEGIQAIAVYQLAAAHFGSCSWNYVSRLQRERYGLQPKPYQPSSKAAAARAMLAALESLCGVYEGHDDVPIYVRKARAAIAQAEAAGITTEDKKWPSPAQGNGGDWV